jgi:tagatose-1,6-bisphosphate aldolase
MLHFTKHCLRLGATTALVALLSTGLALPSHAAGTWKVNITKSTFSSASNTLVLDRYDTKAPATQTGAAAANAFLVVADKKIYLATNDADLWRLVQQPENGRLFPLAGYEAHRARQ